jgi:hypothetical protein
MKITIHCDQIDCKFNEVQYVKENSIPKPYFHVLYLHCICTNPRPVIVTTFGKSLSLGARKCHSKTIKDANNT